MGRAALGPSGDLNHRWVLRRQRAGPACNHLSWAGCPHTLSVPDASSGGLPRLVPSSGRFESRFNPLQHF